MMSQTVAYQQQQQQQTAHLSWLLSNHILISQFLIEVESTDFLLSIKNLLA